MSRMMNGFVEFLQKFKVLAFILIIFLLISVKEKDENYPKSIEKNYSIFALELPDKLNFAGEPVPLENFDVKESLDKELLINTYWQSQTLLFIKRANRYFPIIEPILKEYDIPEDFKYLALIESGLTNAVSPSGAKGFWQILEGTGKDYGLEINNEVDERYHLEKATIAASKFIMDSYEKYNNWTMAAASYNIGRNGLNKQIEKQKVNYYYDLLLNEETARYIYRILAVKLILLNPEKFGFHFNKKDLYPTIPTYKVKVDTSITNFALFAESFSINYKVLKLLNPWLREKHLTNKKKRVYYIKIPRDGYRKCKKQITFSNDSF